MSSTYIDFAKIESVVFSEQFLKHKQKDNHDKEAKSS